RVLAKKTVGPNDAALAELASDAEILPFLAARRAVRILTRASHCRDDEITRTSPGHFGTDLQNLGQSFMTQDEFGGARRRCTVLEGADLAVRAADSHVDSTEQHLRGGRPLRCRSFHQTYAFFLWDDDDGTHLSGMTIWRSTRRGQPVSPSHRDAGRRPVA